MSLLNEEAFVRKINSILLTFALIITLVFAIRNLDDQLSISSEDIHALIEAGEMQIDLAKLTNFEWDTVHVFGPYTTDEMIEDSTGIKFIFGGIDVSESSFLLLFAHADKPIKKIYLSRKYGDYKIVKNKFLVFEKNF